MVRACLSLLVAAGLLLPPPPSAAGDKEAPKDPAADTAGSPENRITPEHQRAIDRGLEWLASRQLDDGAFPAHAQGAATTGADYRTAVTALATLAFLGAGHGLRNGPYKSHLRKSVEWLLGAQASSGYISKGGDSQSKMHGHGFATLALCEAYATAASSEAGTGRTGTSGDAELRSLSARLRRGIQDAVDCIERSQATPGGWYYTPNVGGAGDHEGSVTVCEVQALLAASNRGFTVSLARIQKAREYMKRSQAASGGFKYTLSTIEDESARNTETFALTAAGITTLIGLAEYDRKDAIDKAFRYLERVRTPELGTGSRYPFYSAFYGVQAFHWYGGEKWRNYWLPLRDRILREQAKEVDAGSWGGTDTPVDLGRVYPTAMCLLMLEVPVGYLSIYAK